MEAKLILEDGCIFEGKQFGADISISGEVVFNTGMVGYPETLTDPSYKGQILVLTYPLIGNYGVPNQEKLNEEDTKKHIKSLISKFESDNIHIRGLIISDYSHKYNHWTAVQSLDRWLRTHGIPGIYGVDTREITKKLRTKGVMLGKIVTNSDIKIEDPNKNNLVAEVSIRKPIIYEPKDYFELKKIKKELKSNNQQNNSQNTTNQESKTRILLYDCGVKNNILRCLLDRNATIIRVPWNYNLRENKDEFEYDGIFISNGPGDPKLCTKTIDSIRYAMKNKKPIFGICLGNQILALASGADTYKLKFGHRSQNQPCIEIGTKRCYITSQNHGFAVNEKTIQKSWEPWFINANDKTNEGIKHKTLPFMSVQFHPEACPGPTDCEYLFDIFIDNVKRYKK